MPAVGTIALTIAVGAWDQTLSAAIQLGVNLVALVIAGTATLAVELLVSHPLRRRLAARREAR